MNTKEYNGIHKKHIIIKAGAILRIILGLINLCLGDPKMNPLIQFYLSVFDILRKKLFQWMVLDLSHTAIVLLQL